MQYTCDCGLRQRRRGASRIEEILPSEVRCVRASSDSSWPACWISRPANVLLSDEGTMWNARSFAPAWIRLDLGESAPYIARIDLLPSMEPKDGKVTHIVRIGMNLHQMETVVTMKGEWADRQWAGCTFPEHYRRARYVEILTMDSPSWVAWIRVRIWKEV